MSEEVQDGHAPRPAPLVEVRRGSIVESRHRGHIAVVDGDGKSIASLGEPATVTYMRSSAKLHQAIPLIASGAADRFGFTDREIAIACGSHSGQSIHAATVAGMLRKIGLTPADLKCGVHEPFDRQTAEEMRERREPPNILQNNCSGKHTGMLALALHLGAPTGTYDHPDSAVQLAIWHAVAQFSGVPAHEITIGVDGCGVPVFGLPVRSMALMYARLVMPPGDFEAGAREAAARIVAAATAHPEMIGGTVERFDTEMINAARGRVVSKVGAEGVYTAALLPSQDWPRGLGMAFKIEDGEDRRARPTVAIECLRQLGGLTDAALAALRPYASFPIRNHRGDIVGDIRPLFELERM